MEMLESLRAVFAEILGQAPHVFTPESSPDDVENWDSTSHPVLLLAIENRFAVEFSPEEFGELVTVGAIADAVHRKLAAKAAA